MTTRARKRFADLTTSQPGDWYRIDVRAAAATKNGDSSGGDGSTSSSKSADVYLFDRIGGWFGVTADDFVRDVASLEVEHIDLHLNSPGGDAFEGIAIANVLRQHQADVTVWVDGLAASAASVVAMAGDEIVMSTGAQFMLHEPWSGVIGNAADMRKEAEVLETLTSSLASVYAQRAGGSTADWLAVMAEETWYTAEDAVDAGLADRLATSEDNAKASGQPVTPGGSSSFWDMWDSYGAAERHQDAVRAMYGHEIPRPAAPTKTPAATASGSIHKERSAPVPFTDEQLGTLRTKLGLAADASEDEIVNSVTEVMDEFTKDEPKVAAPAVPEGMKLVDETKFNQLCADAAAGREAREQQERERRVALVDAAIKDGKTTPAAKEFWLKKLELEGEVAEQQLASIASDLVPLTERGHDTMPEGKDADLGWFDTVTTSSREG